MSQRLSQSIFPVIHGYQLDSCTNQIFIRWYELESIDFCVNYNSFDRFVEDQSLVNSPASWIFWKPEGACCIRLRIRVDNESGLLGSSEGGSEVYGGGCLPYTTLLVGDSNNTGQIYPSCGGEFIRCILKYARCFTWNAGSWNCFTWNRVTIPLYQLTRSAYLTRESFVQSPIASHVPSCLLIRYFHQAIG